MNGALSGREASACETAGDLDEFKIEERLRLLQIREFFEVSSQVHELALGLAVAIWCPSYSNTLSRLVGRPNRQAGYLGYIGREVRERTKCIAAIRYRQRQVVACEEEKKRTREEGGARRYMYMMGTLFNREVLTAHSSRTWKADK